MDSAPKRHVIPPAVEAERMRRYSVFLMIGAFLLVGLNFAELTPARLLWFGAVLLGVMIVFAASRDMLRPLVAHEWRQTPAAGVATTPDPLAAASRSGVSVRDFMSRCAR